MMRYGEKSGEVKQVQTELKSLGLYEGVADGVYGPNTMNAVKRFQRLHPPLAPDGIVGEMTWKLIFIEPIKSRQAPVRAPSEDHHRRGIFPHYNDIEKVYGGVGENQTDLVFPFPMKIAWGSHQQVSHTSVHEKAHDAFLGMLKGTLEVYGIEEIERLGLNLFGGCLNVRKMRGGDLWSTHAYGAAMDFNPAANQLAWRADRAVFAQSDYDKFWSIVADYGLVSLGKVKGYDWMHIQAVEY